MDVGAWLRGLGLGQYENVFRDNEVEADVLPDLTEGDLEKLGLPLGPRKRVLKAIASLGNTALQADHQRQIQPHARIGIGPAVGAAQGFLRLGQILGKRVRQPEIGQHRRFIRRDFQGARIVALRFLMAAELIEHRTLRRQDAPYLKQQLEWEDFRSVSAHVRHMVDLLRNKRSVSPCTDAMAHMARLFERTISHKVPAAAQKDFGAPLITHGVAANRKVLETIAQYSLEQGLTPKLTQLEDLFPPSMIAQ